MVRMISHTEASELLGAHALDAVDPDEATAIEEHLRTCPRCRDELRSHREVVGLLAYAGHDAPEGLWDQVVARINDPAESASAPAAVSPPESLRMMGSPSMTVGRRSRRRRFSPVLTLAAAAAVVVVALLGVDVTRLQHRTDHLSGQIAAMADAPTMTTVHHALATPGAKLLALRPVSGHGASLDAVILPGGQGYLYDTKLDPLSAASTYQLWGVVGAQRISYGILGSTPAAVMSFRVSSGVQALAVTTEVAGGVVTSTHTPVVVGLLG